MKTITITTFATEFQINKKHRRLNSESTHVRSVYSQPFVNLSSLARSLINMVSDCSTSKLIEKYQLSKTNENCI